MSTYRDLVLGDTELEPQVDDFATLLVDEWRDQNIAEGPRPLSRQGVWIRHSDAGKCSRAIAFSILARIKGEAPNITERPGVWVTRLGTEVHALYEAVMHAKYGEAVRTEVACGIDGLSAGHADGLVTWEDKTTTCTELKTANGTKYKYAVKGQGPDLSHVLQTSVNAVALGADNAVITMLPMEAMSAGYVKKNGLDKLMRTGVSWELDGPTMRRAASFELARWRKIMETVEAGQLPPRMVPSWDDLAGTVVVDPLKGKTKNADGKTGRAWQCGYCPFQLACERAGEGVVDYEAR